MHGCHHTLPCLPWLRGANVGRGVARPGAVEPCRHRGPLLRELHVCAAVAGTASPTEHPPLRLPQSHMDEYPDARTSVAASVATPSPVGSCQPARTILFQLAASCPLPPRGQVEKLLNQGWIKNFPGKKFLAHRSKFF